jgi:hypothetical protein
VGVRTLVCKCGFAFQPKKVSGPPAIPGPKIAKPEDLPEGKAGLTEVLYDEQGQASLENGSGEVGMLRPILCIALTPEALASFALGGCVPATLNHKEVYLQLQVRRN